MIGSLSCRSPARGIGFHLVPNSNLERLFRGIRRGVVIIFAGSTQLPRSYSVFVPAVLFPTYPYKPHSQSVPGANPVASKLPIYLPQAPLPLHYSYLSPGRAPPRSPCASPSLRPVETSRETPIAREMERRSRSGVSRLQRLRQHPMPSARGLRAYP